jgi:hypothetical protein
MDREQGLNRYGRVSGVSTARLAPAQRPEPQVTSPTYALPTSTGPPSFLAYQPKVYEPFVSPTHVSQPHYFASQERQRGHERPKTHCPHCLVGMSYVRLPHDPTDSVFCTSCRQPYHFCYVHGVALPGMGLSRNDPQVRQCQCQRGQDFLGDKQWNSCFNH